MENEFIDTNNNTSQQTSLDKSITMCGTTDTDSTVS